MDISMDCPIKKGKDRGVKNTIKKSSCSKDKRESPHSINSKNTPNKGIKKPEVKYTIPDNSMPIPQNTIIHTVGFGISGYGLLRKDKNMDLDHFTYVVVFMIFLCGNLWVPLFLSYESVP